MNKIFKIILFLILGVSFSNCTDNEPTPESIPLRDETVQKNDDDSVIITYLKTHKLVLQNANFDVAFSKVTELDPDCMWVKNLVTPTNPNPQYPLLSKTCVSNNIQYTIYYIRLEQGGRITTNTRRPCNLDGVFTTYKGRLMDKYVPVGTNVNGVITTVATGGTSVNDEGTVFDFNENPTDYFNLDAVIRGWSEIFPLFNSGSHIANPDGTNTYSDFGAGVMFVPSGLAYFNGAPGSIPSYSPLIFNFKLYEVRRNDHDFDGIEDFNEDLDRDGYIHLNASNTLNNKASDDTDGDGISDAYDQDDDGDRYSTRSECKRPLAYYPVGHQLAGKPVYDENGVLFNTGFYPYQSYSIDNLSTPYVDESHGIPDCNQNFTNSTRLRRHLDKNCH